MAHTVQLATRSDIETIQRLAAAVWPVAYSGILAPAQLEYMLGLFYADKALLEQMQGKGHQFVLAMDNADTPVGFGSFSVESKTAYLHKLYVLPETQGSGAGAALLQRCEAESAREGATAMQLNVNRHNRAKAFYERRGYRVLFEEDIAIGSGYFMNDFRMEKGIGP